MQSVPNGSRVKVLVAGLFSGLRTFGPPTGHFAHKLDAFNRLFAHNFDIEKATSRMVLTFPPLLRLVVWRPSKIYDDR